VRQSAEKLGWKVVNSATNTAWNVFWMDSSVSTERVQRLRAFQKINHFPGMHKICRKSELARSLNRMKRLAPLEYNFYPKTWVLPTDVTDLRAYLRKKGRLVIVKPSSGCQVRAREALLCDAPHDSGQGRGIYLTYSAHFLDAERKSVAQQYIAHPLLIDKLKFDLRVYALVVSCGTLTVTAEASQHTAA
jgi:tubulin polyglutamylase TTLL6/13